MQDWDRSLQLKNGNLEVSKFPAYHIWLSTRDMARIGLLMLRKGKWKEKQVVPENWVEEMITQRTSYREGSAKRTHIKGRRPRFGLWIYVVVNRKHKRLQTKKCIFSTRCIRTKYYSLSGNRCCACF